MTYYDVPIPVIAVLLFASMALAIELGFRLGLRRKGKISEGTKEQVNTTETSILGILGLLLAFTFSLSLQRFDSRSEAVVDEANAIGTAYLRAQLIPPPLRDEVQQQLRDYLRLRIEAGSVSVVQQEQWDTLFAKAGNAQAALWANAVRAAEMNPNPVISGLYVQALNEVIDSFGRRDAALNRQVPKVVLIVLCVTFLITGTIIGYACGIGGQRPSLTTYAMVALIVVLVGMILDLDRPRRGRIQVSEKPLLDLQSSIETPAGTGTGTGRR